MKTSLVLRGVCGFVVGCLVFGMTARADASGVSNASRHVIRIYADGPTYVRFALDGATITGRPACHQPWFPTDYMFDATTNGGKAMLSVLQSAFLSGKLVGVEGSNSCGTATPDLNIVETVNWLSVSN